MIDAFADAPRLIIPDSAWEANGYPGDEKSRLIATVRVNGVLCHVDAIRVKNDDEECQVADDYTWDETFMALYDAVCGDGHFNTTTIRDWGEYVIVISPFCR